MIRSAGAGAAGALAALTYTAAAGAAFAAHSRQWEMGGIPLVLSAWVFTGFLAGSVASLLAGRRPYLASTVAIFLLIVGGQLLLARRDTLLPQMARDLLALVSAGAPFQAIVALWGALVTDPAPGGRAARLAPLRELSYAPGWLLSFLALLGPGIHFIPRYGGLAAALAPALYFVWVARRNQRASSPLTGRL